MQSTGVMTPQPFSSGVNVHEDSGVLVATVFLLLLELRTQPCSIAMVCRLCSARSVLTWTDPKGALLLFAARRRGARRPQSSFRMKFRPARLGRCAREMARPVAAACNALPSSDISARLIVDFALLPASRRAHGPSPCSRTNVLLRYNTSSYDACQARGCTYVASFFCTTYLEGLTMVSDRKQLISSTA